MNSERGGVSLGLGLGVRTFLLQKYILRLVKAVFSSPLCYKKLKLTIKPFKGRTLCSLLIQI